MPWSLFGHQTKGWPKVSKTDRSQETNLFWDLPENEKSRRFLVKIFMRSHSSEDLKKDLKDQERFYTEIFSSKNLQKIYIKYRQKIFKNFLPKIFFRPLRDLQLKSFWYLSEIFGRSSSKFWKNSGKSSKSWEDLRIKSSKNLFEIL